MASQYGKFYEADRRMRMVLTAIVDQKCRGKVVVNMAQVELNRRGMRVKFNPHTEKLELTTSKAKPSRKRR